LRIFIGESGWHGLLYEWLVLEARRQGLAGTTVLHGIVGFGANSRAHTSKAERLSEDLPIIYASKESEQFLASVEPSICEGLVTLEKTYIRFYRASKLSKA
jgi:PII-like signaling protein